MSQFRSKIEQAQGERLQAAGDALEAGERFAMADLLTALLGKEADVCGWISSTTQADQDVQRALELARRILPEWGVVISTHKEPELDGQAWRWVESHSVHFNRTKIIRSILRDDKGKAVDKGPHEVWGIERSKRHLGAAICRAIVQVALNSDYEIEGDRHAEP